LMASSSGEEHHFDIELDKHMMQTINDVKFTCRPKFTDIGDVNFQRECLDAHNALRTRYGCSMLIWSQELSELAHTWALKLADRGRVLYPELRGIGENILLSTTTTAQTHLPSGKEVVEIWASEADKVNFDAPRWSPLCQHFTQIVWRSTHEMGVSRCWNQHKSCVAVVAFYRIAGNSNAPGEFAANVPPQPVSNETRSPPSPSGQSPALRRVMKALKRSVTINDAGHPA